MSLNQTSLESFGGVNKFKLCVCVEKITRHQLGYMSNNCAKMLIFNTGELLCLYILPPTPIRFFLKIMSWPFIQEELGAV